MVYGLNIVRGLVAAARIDGLTGLSNRRYMLESLNKEVLRAQRHGLQFSIVFLDVDNFRRVNNVLGHIQGDTVLECVSKIITSTIRGSDIASRWGGDEFVVLLAGTAREGAKAFSDRFLERLNRAIHQLEMPFEIAVSSGTSTYPEDGVTGESLLKVADYRMYQVKRARTASLKRSSLHLRRP
jgi:diguanylate cyclase (GGDEF)-like protein